MATGARALPVIGWREWVTFTEFGRVLVKAKVDTGARSSSLHAWDLTEEIIDGRPWVRFVIHPFQRDTEATVEAHAPLLERRHVRNSGGQVELRPVIETPLELLGQVWPIELTLTRRDEMGFRMLLGRQAIRRRFVVDSGRSFMSGGDRHQREGHR